MPKLSDGLKKQKRLKRPHIAERGYYGSEWGTFLVAEVMCIASAAIAHLKHPAPRESHEIKRTSTEVLLAHQKLGVSTDDTYLVGH